MARLDVATEATAVRRRIGFAMQEVGADEPATGREFVTMQGRRYGLSRRWLPDALGRCSNSSISTVRPTLGWATTPKKPPAPPPGRLRDTDHLPGRAPISCTSRTLENAGTRSPAPATTKRPPRTSSGRLGSRTPDARSRRDPALRVPLLPVPDALGSSRTCDHPARNRVVAGSQTTAESQISLRRGADGVQTLRPSMHPVATHRQSAFCVLQVDRDRGDRI